jgi:hypothetical protein
MSGTYLTGLSLHELIQRLAKGIEVIRQNKLPDV